MKLKLITIALFAMSGAAFAQTLTNKTQEQINIIGGKASVIEICNYNNFPARIDIVPMQYPNGDTTKAMVSASNLVRIRPSSAGTVDDPILPVATDKKRGCQTVTVAVKKKPDRAQFLYLATTVSPVIKREEAAFTVGVIPTGFQLVSIGVEAIDDVPELSGVVGDDGVLIKNTGKRPVAIQAFRVDGVNYQVSKFRQIFTDSEAKVFAPPKAVEAIREAVKKGKQVVVLNHYGDPVPLKL